MPDSEGPGVDAGGSQPLSLEVYPGRLAICRLSPAAELPSWARDAGGFATVSRTADELSITADQHRVPEGVRAARDYRLIRVCGPLPLHLIGVLASLAEPLARARISIFAISTYDTDYVLVKESDLARAVAALEQAGHRVRIPAVSSP